MYYFFVTIIVIASVLITIAVLLQNSKGGGLASNFGAGNTTFGVRQAADILEKGTWILAAIIIVFSIAATAAVSSKGSNASVLQQVKETSKTPANAGGIAVPGTAQETPASEAGQPANQ